jgi:hypothetical protein
MNDTDTTTHQDLVAIDIAKESLEVLTAVGPAKAGVQLPNDKAGLRKLLGLRG